MEIALIRHARPGTVDHGTDSAHAADPELDDIGHAQVALLADYLARPEAPAFTALHASTMRRAVQTATAIGDRLGLTVAQHADLVEYDHDLPFYTPTEEIEGDFETYWADLQRGIYAGHPIDLAAFTRRVVGAIDRIIAAHSAHDLVGIVCHGGVISAYLAHIVRSDAPLFFEGDYTSISRVLVTDSGRRQLLSAAESPHRGFDSWISGRDSAKRPTTKPS